MISEDENEKEDEEDEENDEEENEMVRGAAFKDKEDECIKVVLKP